ncbi:MAG: class I SAM-dependent methyltransferase [Ignavibacteria bacterium]|nr:class I SAM-dependent methyltransferase [Ignavibacteria bacterium]
MKDRDTVSRFSNRVENYVKYRPHYPAGMVNLLEKEFGISHLCKVADIGSGTGISAEQFVESGYTVYGVDPNSDMRAAAESFYSGNDNFISINGSAEVTTLPDNCIDIIIAGQAFHWFEKSAARIEFKRILKDNGLVFLIWNKKKSGEGFMNEYFALLEKYGTDYNKVKHENYESQEIEEFFSPDKFRLHKLDNVQVLDYEALEGRLLSSSYIPLSGPKFDELIKELKDIHKKYNNNGLVTLEYETVIYAGSLS